MFLFIIIIIIIIIIGVAFVDTVFNVLLLEITSRIQTLCHILDPLKY